MKNKMKILVILIIVILTVLTMFLFVNNKMDKTGINKLNNNSELIKDQMLGNLKISNVTVSINKDKTSTFSADVSNTSDTLSDINEITIIIKDKNGKVLTTLAGYVGVGLKKGDVSKISATTEIDLSNAYSVEYRGNR